MTGVSVVAQRATLPAAVPGGVPMARMADGIVA
jgi:hypothetical protein